MSEMSLSTPLSDMDDVMPSQQSQILIFWRRFSRNIFAVLGLFIVLAFIFVGIFFICF